MLTSPVFSTSLKFPTTSPRPIRQANLRSGTTSPQFASRVDRTAVPSEPELVQEYLERLRDFPSASRVRFVQIFERLLSGRSAHVQLAVQTGKEDAHIQWLNEHDIDLLRKRHTGNAQEQAEARTALASMMEAQLLFLAEIGREDLIAQYRAFKQRRAAEQD